MCIPHESQTPNALRLFDRKKYSFDTWEQFQETNWEETNIYGPAILYLKTSLL